MYAGPPIVITGFMGSGKSTIAAAVADELSCPLIDLDDVVTRKTGRTPREIIDDEGERSFRLTEAYALESVMRGRQSVVIALGGGTWLNEQNRQLIENYKAVTFWLDAPFELCWSRIPIGGEDVTGFMFSHLNLQKNWAKRNCSAHSKKEARDQPRLVS